MSAREKASGLVRARGGWWAAALLATALLMATLLGGGRAGLAIAASDGSAWLWSRSAGEVDRVNPDNGRVEQRRQVTDARGHRVQVTQNDRYLLIHDLDTGRVSSINLNGLGFSGRLDVGTRGDPHLAMGSDAAALIERTSGAVRAVDPTTLRPVGPVLKLPGPLVGGEFDDAGLLWVAAPGQGTVVALKVTQQGATVAKTAGVAEPGHDLALTALDRGALVVDRGGRDLVVATSDGTRRFTAPVPLDGAMVPDRTHGPLAAVTVPAAGAVVTVGDVRKDGPVRSFPLSDPVQEPAVPFAGKVYLPVRTTGQVRVFEPGGRQTGVLNMPAGRGDLEVQVREGNLFVNAPGSTDALVVGDDGAARTIGKYPGGRGHGGSGPSNPGGGENSPPQIPVPPIDPIFPNPFDPGTPSRSPEAPTPSEPGKPTLTAPAQPSWPSLPRGPRTPRSPHAPNPSTPARTTPSTGTGPSPGGRPTTGPTTSGPKPTSPRPSTPKPSSPKPTTPRPTTPKPTTHKPTPTKPKPKPTQTRQPYTPQQVCNASGGGSYTIQRSVSFSGGRVYLLYSAATKNNCAVTMKTTNIGKGTSAWVRLQSQTGGKTGSDSGTFKYYAGPVFVHAPGICVRFSGGASGASASAGWANCG
ncbi:hypothetical protein [Actinomadura violacea]|uniref:Uncharacterized protein n=1 Tax=Actinomadura violacea TaxID=2819934 RepID=A0ABS3RHW7_9ACTN|nr:hypothetical protein [Actinomadura violacea]MBO2456319.1 hypothetical protein [Actinomadura violacea]